MLDKRFTLLFFISASLAALPLAHADVNLLPDADTPAKDTGPLQVSMLGESQGQQGTGEPVANAIEAIPAATDTAITIPPATDTRFVVDDTEVEPQIQFSDEELAALRKLFLKAENAVKKRNSGKYKRLAAKLEDYPLYPYLQYQWLKKHLGNDREIKAFLDKNKTSRYASILKRKWLYNLGKKRQWKKFLGEYTPTSDTTLQCYYQRAQYNSGNKETALEAAKGLWVVGKSQPKACDPLFAVLKKTDMFTDELVWQRFTAAMQNNKSQLAKYIKKSLPAADQRTADLWLKIHRNPERNWPKLLNVKATPQTPLMFVHAIKRYARKDVYQAIDVWDKTGHRFNISDEDINDLERSLAFRLAYKNDLAAYDRLGKLSNSDFSSKTKRIRLALYEQDWPRVIAAINDLSEANQKNEKWQYWLARAYIETGHPVQAHELLTELSEKRDFYGYMAAERLDREYQLSHDPVDVTAQDIDAISHLKEFQVAFELLALDREKDAKLQWWHAVRQLDEADIPAAAKLAQRWQWDEVAIFTIARIKYWDDIKLRFPMRYSDEIQAQAELYDLDPVILFGLIRRESAFNDDAYSPAGARGLMQIMPGTGKQIARDLKERWRGSYTLFDAQKNLRYGSYYYQKLLSQFNGHYALALAAYNAGPHRVKQWLPDEALPADIWIETIPFKETREYVTTVLVYSMIYQQLMETDKLSMNDLTRDVEPLSDVALNTKNGL